jgi:hypothetical protein
MPNDLIAIQDDLVQSSAVDGDVEGCGDRDRLGQRQIRTIDAKQDSPALGLALRKAFSSQLSVVDV